MKTFCCALPPASSAAASIRWPRQSSRRPPSARSSFAAVSDFDSPSGKGVTGMVERRRVALGNAKFLAELGIATNAMAERS